MAGALVDRSLQVIMITAGLLAVGAALCHRGQAAVYWSGDSLGRANLDGSAALWPLPNGWNPGQGAVASYGVAVDGESLYWAEMNAGAIAGSTTDGTWPNFSLIAGLGLPSGVAVHQDKIYWSDLETGSIGRANLDGSEVDPNFISGGSRTCGVATDGHYLYWANQEAGWIGRAELDGGNVEQAFIDGLGLPCGVDVGAGYLFWGDQDLRSLGRAALDGSAVNRDFVVDAEEPWDVAVSGSHVYWAKRWGWEPGREGGLGRANIAGTEVIAQLVPA